MRVDAPAIVFLCQTAGDSLDSFARAPWWAVMILALLGGTAGIAKAWSVVAEYLRDKRELARRLADEEKLRRDAKLKAEIEQLEALTSMARDVPKQFHAMTTSFDAALARIGETNALISKRIDESAEATRALRGEVHELKDELRSDTRALVAAIAGKLGVQTNTDETNLTARRSVPGPAMQEQRA
jgi:hypothetical protein